MKDLGAATAYAYAVEEGYTGTEEEFAALMADFTTAAETATAAAEAAEAAAASLTVDDELDDESTNPVQNAVITNELSTVKDGLNDVNETLADITGNVPLQAFEIGVANVSNGAITYSSSTNKIRTKQGTLNHAKQGDKFSMTSSGLYKYFICYSADGVSGWDRNAYSLDTATVEAPIDGYYVIVIGKRDDSTITQNEVSEIASKMQLTRTVTSGIEEVLTEAGDTWEV